MSYNIPMKSIREIISNNITAHRKRLGLTQVELSKKVNFSDKAVSRWEKGEVLPDIETLQELAQIFNVPLHHLLEERNDIGSNGRQKIKKEDIAVQILSVCIAWCVLTVLFVYIQIFYGFSFWQAFVWGIPISSVIILYHNRKWNDLKIRFAFRTILNWSFLTSVYLHFLHLNMWLIFFIGIPIQISIIVAHLARRVKIKHKDQ